MTPDQELRDLWSGIYFGAPQQTEADSKWAEQRERHLPLTLKVIENAEPPPLEYKPVGVWRSEQGAGASDVGDGIRTLLLMVGTSDEQLALSVAVHANDARSKNETLRIVPFASEDLWPNTTGTLAECLGLLQLLSTCDLPADCQPVDPNDPARVFQKIRDWLRSDDASGCRVAIDCTGGKKPMDSGAIYAASYYDIPAYYMNFDRYHSTYRRPEPHTSRYCRLSLPDSSFSLASRKRIIEAVEGLKFDIAVSEIEQLRIAAAGGGFLEDERESFDALLSFVTRSRSWWMHAYESEELEDHKLNGTFSEKLGPGKLLNRMIRSPEILFEYVADEFWRLSELYERDKRSRECVVGAVGLVEVITECILRSLITEEDQKLQFPAKQTIKLLKVGEGYGRGASDTKTLTIEKPPLRDIETGIYKEQWGKYPDCGWVQLRHNIAHLRVPLREDVPQQIFTTYVPRFVELLHRIAHGVDLRVEESGREDWVTWWSDDRWTADARVPWRKLLREGKVEEWLQLRV